MNKILMNIDFFSLMFDNKMINHKNTEYTNNCNYDDNYNKC